jgi:hypothetical protein
MNLLLERHSIPRRLRSGSFSTLPGHPKTILESGKSHDLKRAKGRFVIRVGRRRVTLASAPNFYILTHPSVIFLTFFIAVY